MSKVSTLAGSPVLTNVVGVATLLVAAYGVLYPPSGPSPENNAALSNAQGLPMFSTGHPILFSVTAIIGLILLLPSWVALFRSFRTKANTATTVESPLIRRDTGALDWKPIQFEQIANKAFINAEVPLDGKRYIDCTFEHCTFVYEGSAPGEIIGDNSKLIRRNPNEINFALRSSNPIVTAAWQLQHKVREGGAGLVGTRFEPIN